MIRIVECIRDVRSSVRLEFSYDIWDHKVSSPTIEKELRESMAHAGKFLLQSLDRFVEFSEKIGDRLQIAQRMIDLPCYVFLTFLFDLDTICGVALDVQTK